MKGFVAVMRQELAHGRNLVLTALVLVVLPQAMRLLPRGLGRLEPEQVSAAAWVTLFAFAAIGSVVTGASALGRDLGAGRLGFFFSRPLSTTAIWGGKLSAAFLLTALGALLLLVPAALMGEMPRLPVDFTVRAARYPFVLLLLLAVAVLVLVSHLAGVIYRSRSLWIVADLVLLAVAARWGIGLLGRVVPEFLSEIAAGARGLALIAVCLTAATAAQLSWGRTDRRRGHAALSVTLWATLLVGLASAEAYARWLAAVGPADLVSFAGLEAAPQGPWVRVGGWMRHRGPLPMTLLYDAASGAYLREGASWPLAFSDDGRRAISLARERSWSDTGTACVMLADLEASPPSITRTSLCFPSAEVPWAMAWSADGGSLLFVQPRMLAVYSVPDFRLRAAAAMSEARSLLQTHFVTGDAVRAYVGREDGGLDVIEMDVSTGRVRGTGEVPAEPVAPAATARSRTVSWPTVQVSPRRDRILVWSVGRSLALHDATTGTRLTTLSASGTTSSEFLSDGRVAVVEKAGVAARLRVFSGDGREERSVSIDDLASATGTARRAIIGGEPAPGQLAVGLVGSGYTGAPSETRILDLASGQVLRREAGLQPVARRSATIRLGAARRVPLPGSPASRLFKSDAGELVQLDVATGARRVVLATRN